VLAINGYFLRWLWHVNNSGPVNIPFPRPNSTKSGPKKRARRARLTD
jgi:hypothetical protein